MKFFKWLPSNTVFLLPVVALAVGLILVNASNDRARALYDARFEARFEADASLRLMIRNYAIETAVKEVNELISIMSARSYADVGFFGDIPTKALVTSLGERLSSEQVHLIIGSVSDNGNVYVKYAFPRAELVGREISNHPMLADFDLGMTPPFIDQISYRASTANDLSYTSEGPVAFRRMLMAIPNREEPLIFISKSNGYENQRFIDGILRELGPVPKLRVSLFDPTVMKCRMLYVSTIGEEPCPAEDIDLAGSIVSEKFGVLMHITPTEAYFQEFEGGRPTYAYTGLLATLIASAVTLAIAVFFRRRLGETERELLAYRGTLKSKNQFTTALHSMVSKNLAQVSSLARRVKSADGIETEEHRYLNIALAEIGQLRLSLDAQIMADALGRGDFQALAIEGVIDTKQLCQSVRLELERVADDEGVECRLLADDGLLEVMSGSQYWTESAILALINASQSFTDEGFIEVSIWMETSMRGQAELYVRCRDTGISWSTETDHVAVTVLTNILSGIGAKLRSKPLQSGAGQEHFIHFPYRES